MKRTLILVATCLTVAVVPLVAEARTSHVRRASDAVSALDKQWLTTGLQGDLFEVQGGKLAERRSHNRAVLKLARTLVKDHSKSYSEGAALARRLGVEVPTSPTASQTWELKVVSLLRPKAFNHWYSSLEALDHEQDISDTTTEVNTGTNSEVRKDAKNELPMLHRHLNLARAALAKSK